MPSAQGHIGRRAKRDARPLECVDRAGRLHVDVPCRVYSGIVEPDRVDRRGRRLDDVNLVVPGRIVARNDPIGHVLQNADSVIAVDHEVEFAARLGGRPRVDPLVDKLMIGRGVIKGRLRRHLAAHFGRDVDLRAGDNVDVAGPHQVDLGPRGNRRVGSRPQMARHNDEAGFFGERIQYPQNRTTTANRAIESRSKRMTVDGLECASTWVSRDGRGKRSERLVDLGWNVPFGPQQVDQVDGDFP